LNLSEYGRDLTVRKKGGLDIKRKYV